MRFRRSIAYLRRHEGRYEVAVQDFVPGEDTRQSARPLVPGQEEWHVESFHTSPDGRRVVISRLRPEGEVLLAEGVPGVRRAVSER